jgi:hypothetical protein
MSLCDNNQTICRETKNSLTDEYVGHDEESTSDSAFEKSNSSISRSSSDTADMLIAGSTPLQIKKSSGMPWTDEEENALRRGIKMFGYDWKEIMTHYFIPLKDRSISSLRTKAKRLGLQ